MKATITKALDRIEKEHGVKIILACESGSRAWGFPSRDSDYDVRFIFVNPKDAYLSIADNRDVIEIPIDDLLDINGWDLKKSLQLMRKSNAPLMEWLSSPIQYQVWPDAYDKLVALSRLAFMPKTSCHHYLAMARRSVAQFQQEEKVRLKTYMYAIRPVLCCQWIIDRVEQPPMRMDDLLAGIGADRSFKEEVTRLIARKRDLTEKDTVHRSAIVENYLRQKIAQLPGRIPDNPPKPDLALFDNAFRSILEDSNI